MNPRSRLAMKTGMVALVLTGFLVSSFWSVEGTIQGAWTGEALAAVGAAKSEGPAPDFELQDMKGSSFRLSKFKGERPVLLYFWATWCPYCIAVKPQIAKLREKHPQGEMEILGINVGEGDSIERLKRYLEGHPVSWPILYDTGGKVSRTYQVQGIPLFVLVDKQGNIVFRGVDPPKDPKEYLP